MTDKNVIQTLLFTALLAAATTSQAVVVSFSGTLDAFNTGPFNAGDAFSGSFILDESVTTSNGVFTGAVDSFTLTVAGQVFTGTNGRIQQFSSANGLTDFISINLGGSNGSVSGSVRPDVFTHFSADWRGANLFTDKNTLAHDLTIADFGYTRITIGFNNSSFDSAIDAASSITFGPLTSVPLPASAWLLASGMLGLLGRARRKTA